MNELHIKSFDTRREIPADVLLTVTALENGVLSVELKDGRGNTLDLGGAPKDTRWQGDHQEFGPAFALFRDYFLKNINPEVDPAQAVPDSIYLRGNSGFSRWVDIPILGFHEAGQVETPDLRGNWTYCLREYQERRTAYFDQLVREAEQKRISEAEIKKAERMSISDSVMREEIADVIQRATTDAGVTIRRSDIAECANQIMRRENLLKRSYRRKDGKQVHYNVPRLHEIIRDELHSMGYQGYGQMRK